ncbi:hypothetical protein ACFL2V_01140 [Pseudomonadota bacterium]
MTEEYLFGRMRYIELNPVRANMVKGPGAYRWSSYAANALGRDDSWITKHPLFKRLGRTNEKRRLAYRALFKAHIDEEDLSKIRASWQTGTPLGNDEFRAKIEERLGCKVGQARRGRPNKKHVDA